MPVSHNGDCSISYSDQGDGDAIILVPGLGGSIQQMAKISNELSRNYRVITVDPRGAGDSDKPDTVYSGPLLAQDMVSVLDAAGVDRADFVGISFGGMIGQALALKNPDRVRSLTLVSSYAASDAWTDRMWLVREQIIEKLGMEEHFSLALMFLFSPRSFRDDADTIRAFEEGFARKQPDKTGYIRQLEYCRDHDVLGRLSEIKAPTLVITGSEDVLATPLMGRDLANGIPNARYLEIPEVSHLFMITQPELLTGAVHDFLRNNRWEAPT